MARIQILELPYDSKADEQPFALVIDQADESTYQSLAYGTTYDSDNGQRPLHQALKDDLGARAILCFEETIEIPANDVSGYATPVTTVHLNGDDLLPERVKDKIAQATAQARRGQPT